MKNINKAVTKINCLLNPNEEIEYVTFEKDEDGNLIALTNQRIIYSNKCLLKDNIFHFFNIKNNRVATIGQLKKKLQLDNDINEIIKKYF